MQFIQNLPPHLTCKAKPLIGIFGLDVEAKQLHNMIWKTFTSNRNAERSPMHFKLITDSMQLPGKKQRDQNYYEFHMAKGILKLGWLNKHLNEIPSIIVVFIELEFEDSDWQEKIDHTNEILSRVENIINGRNIQVVVALLQSKALLPPIEDPYTHEKAQEFCLKCNIKQKHFFVVPKDDVVLSYVIRLEKEFFTLSAAYYAKKIKQIRSYRNELDKTVHQNYFIRHEFKVAFFNEIRQEFSSALKFYRTAYNYVLESRKSESHLMEYKALAAFINYKICRITFSSSATEAINQFRIHIDAFVYDQGNSELLFEHEAWLSKQFQIFGDLFNEAIKCNLSPLLTQNPGSYYQEAARYEIRRRDFVQTFINNLSAEEIPPDFEKEMLQTPDFFGQRPWKMGKRASEPTDKKRERLAILFLRRTEAKVEHWQKIVNFLEMANDQYSRFKANRIQSSNMYLIAKEYMRISNFSKCLSKLEQIADVFRTEQWEQIFSELIKYLFMCNKSLCDKSKIISNAIEIISPECRLEDKFKEEVAKEIQNILTDESFKQSSNLQVYDLSKLKSFLKCKAFFYSTSQLIDEPIKFFVIFKCQLKASVQLSNISVDIEFKLRSYKVPTGAGVVEQKANQSPKKDERPCCIYTGTVDMHAEDGPLMGLYFTLDRAVANRFALINSITFNMAIGSGGLHSIPCIWNFNPNSNLNPKKTPLSLYHREQGGDCLVDSMPQDWDHIENRLVTEILNKETAVSFSIETPDSAMICEKLPIQCQFRNNELFPIGNIEYSFRLTEVSSLSDSTYSSNESRTKADPSSAVALENLEFKSLIDKKLDPDHVLEPSASLNETIYALCTTLGQRELHLSLQYSIPSLTFARQEIHLLKLTDSKKRMSPMDCLVLHSWTNENEYKIHDLKCSLVQTHSISVNESFQIDYHLSTLQHREVCNLIINELFILKANIVNNSANPIKIIATHFDLNQHLKVNSLDLEPTMNRDYSITLNKQESMTNVRVCSVHESAFSGEQIHLGYYRIEWIRSVDERDPFSKSLKINETIAPLGRFIVHSLPLRVDLKMPSFGYEDELIFVKYQLLNTTIYPQDINISVTKTDDFNFAGFCNSNITLLPEEPRVFPIRIFPQRVGNLELPKIEIKFINELFQIGLSSDKVLQNLPTHMFIKPKDRSDA